MGEPVIPAKAGIQRFLNKKSFNVGELPRDFIIVLNATLNGP